MIKYNKLVLFLGLSSKKILNEQKFGFAITIRAKGLVEWREIVFSLNDSSPVWRQNKQNLTLLKSFQIQCRVGIPKISITVFSFVNWLINHSVLTAREFTKS